MSTFAGAAPLTGASSDHGTNRHRCGKPPRKLQWCGNGLHDTYSIELDPEPTHTHDQSSNKNGNNIGVETHHRLPLARTLIHSTTAGVDSTTGAPSNDGTNRHGCGKLPLYVQRVENHLSFGGGNTPMHTYPPHQYPHTRPLTRERRLPSHHASPTN